MATLVNYTYDGLTDQIGDWVLVKKKKQFLISDGLLI